MVAFRKLSPAFAVFALLLGAEAANAQTGFSCTASSVPTAVRSEGFTELMGDVVLTCTGGPDAATTPIFANFQITLNTNITNRIVASGAAAENRDLTDALLLIDDPGGARGGQVVPTCLAGVPSENPTTTACNPALGLPGGISTPFQQTYRNAFRGARATLVSGQNENVLVWENIPILPPGSAGTRTIRFTNIRGNATAIPVSGTLVPSQIRAFISIFPFGSINITQAEQTVAYPQIGVVVDRRNCANDDARNNPTLNQCQALNSDWFGDPSRTQPINNATSVLGLRYREGFQNAFKTAPQEAGIGGSYVGRPASFSSAITSGTRLYARFSGLPNNIRLFVSTTQVSNTAAATPAYSTTTTAGATTTALSQAVLLTGTDAAGATQFGSAGGLGIVPTVPTAPAGVNNIAIGCGTGANAPATELPIVNNTALAVWEVTNSSETALETLFFYVAVAYRVNQPSLATATVNAGFAPFYAAGTTGADRMSATLPIPRFVSAADSPNALTIGACRTNLLFPYVTNQFGFETGIAIANTSEDAGVFSDPQNRRQAGRCRINYYGLLQNGNAPNPAQETTNRDIAAGEVLTFTVSGGNTAVGLAGSPTFQGYIIAQCDFLYAHGFAFIVNGSLTNGIAEGYLALVLDGGDGATRAGRGGSLGEVRGF